MALVVADRVQETTSTTGTSDYVLLGAEAGYQAFGDVMADSDTTYYAVTDDVDWEVGIGTYSTTGPTLVRTTILESSNSDAAVNWGAGNKKIFLTYAAERSVYLNANGDLSVDGTTLYVDSTNNRVGVGTATPATTLDVSGSASAVFFENPQTITSNYTIASGKNAMNTGPITIASGVTVTVSAGSRYVVI